MAEPPQSPASLFPEQVDEAASHTRPVIFVQLDKPQAHDALLIARPSFLLHTTNEQVDEAASHTRPESESDSADSVVHVDEPQ